MADAGESRKAPGTASNFFGKLGGTASATGGAILKKVDSTRQKAQEKFSGLANTAEGTAAMLAKSASSVASSAAELVGSEVEDNATSRLPDTPSYRDRAEGFLATEVADKELLWTANSTLQEAQAKSVFQSPDSPSAASASEKTAAACLVTSGGGLAEMLQQIAGRVAQQLQEAEARAAQAELELGQVRAERDRLAKENVAFRRRLGQDAAMAALIQHQENSEDEHGLVDQLLSRINDLESELQRRPLNFAVSTDSASSFMVQRPLNYAALRSVSSSSLGSSSSSSSALKGSQRPNVDTVPLLSCATAGQSSRPASSAKTAGRSSLAGSSKAVMQKAGSDGDASSMGSAAGESSASASHAVHGSSSSQAERETFSVQVDRSTGASLGLELHQTKEENCLTILLVKPGNLLAAWNLQNPSSAVRAGDKIVRVNGHAGTAKELVEKMKQSSILMLAVQRGTAEEAARVKVLLAERTRPTSPIAGAKPGLPQHSTEDKFVSPLHVGRVEGAHLDGEENMRRMLEVSPLSGSPQRMALLLGSGENASSSSGAFPSPLREDDSSLATVPEEEALSTNEDEHQQFRTRGVTREGSDSRSPSGTDSRSPVEDDDEDDDEDEEDEEAEEAHKAEPKQ